MDSISVTDAKVSFSKFLNRVAYGRERLVITSHGEPKAALISVDDLRQLEEMEDAQAARKGLAAYRAGETVPYEEFRAELVAEGLLDE